jgi:alcohol dehydrogenase class IV
MTLPDDLVGITAANALSNAIEAFISLAATTLTDVHAVKALRILTKSLATAVRERKPEDLENLALASLHAGMAFSNAMLGIVHALALSIGGCYDVNHASITAVLLLEVISYDIPIITEKLQELAWGLGHQANGNTRVVKENILNRLSELLQASGAPRTLGSIGVLRADLPVFACQAAKNVSLVTSPREIDEDDLLRILELAY